MVGGLETVCSRVQWKFHYLKRRFARSDDGSVGNATVTKYFLEMLTMTTNVRGRSGNRTHSRTSQYPTGATRTGYSKNWGRTTKRQTTTSWNIPTQWKNCSDTLVRKINSYRTLYNQTKGPARYDRPSPTTINSFANWIGKGANVHTVTTNQLSRWAKATHKNFNTRTPTPNACKTVLWAKFGRNTIKAVARTKSGSFMVATTPVVNGKPFFFPK